MCALSDPCDSAHFELHRAREIPPLAGTFEETCDTPQRWQRYAGARGERKREGKERGEGEEERRREEEEKEREEEGEKSCGEDRSKHAPCARSNTGVKSGAGRRRKRRERRRAREEEGEGEGEGERRDVERSTVRVCALKL